MSRSSQLIAAVSGIASTVFALGGVALAVALAPWFSVTANALSDLGVADSAVVAAAFNGGLLLAGMLALPYAWALWVAAGDAAGRAVAAAFAVAALLMAGVGAFPSGSPLHYPVAVGLYLAITVVLATDGLGRRATAAGRLSGVAAAVHLVQWSLYVEGVRLGPGLAIPELVGAALLAAWVIAGSPVAPVDSWQETDE
ncbi:DUF998 domain-containing protein [Halobaculum gomorrense]|uniref:DUF998 domain-containing protein n=1 Tax=Halobaculum gomorrense TaxID=43928 RepID=UPI00190E6D72|nr:DUF998 domain-containing protein [Halobaculum gomorrense]